MCHSGDTTSLYAAQAAPMESLSAVCSPVAYSPVIGYSVIDAFRDAIMNHSARRVNALARRLDASRYLEIGVSTGSTFREVEIAERTGVDPAFGFNTSEVENDFTRCATKTSDEFFSVTPIFPPFDIILIDGLHTFEQVVRDFSNVILRTHRRSVILLDDTWPNDVYSSLPDMNATFKYRKAAGLDNSSWHGDVFKTVFYIHDFWPSLNYRTIVGSGNQQTLVWRANGEHRKPLFNSLERISRLSYFEMIENVGILRQSSEDEAIDLCLAELGAS
jgi:hypothetical protein